MAWTQEQIDEIYVKVQRLAATDEEFRSDLLADPVKAIQKVSEMEIPSDFRIKIIENDPEYAATFVLPDMISEEIADGDLDSVAGGVCGVDNICAAQIKKF